MNIVISFFNANPISLKVFKTLNIEKVPKWQPYLISHIIKLVLVTLFNICFIVEAFLPKELHRAFDA
jgi:hypothetical protein